MNKMERVPNLSDLLAQGALAYFTEDDSLRTRYRVLLDPKEEWTINAKAVKLIDDPSLAKGWYLHYKNKYYYVFGVAVDTKGNKYVLYHGASPVNEKGLWLRPYEMFIGSEINAEGEMVKRFLYKAA